MSLKHSGGSLARVGTSTFCVEDLLEMRRERVQAEMERVGEGRARE